MHMGTLLMIDSLIARTLHQQFRVGVTHGLLGGLGRPGTRTFASWQGWQHPPWQAGIRRVTGEPHLAKIHSRRHPISNSATATVLLPTTNSDAQFTTDTTTKTTLQPQIWARFTDRSPAPVSHDEYCRPPLDLCAKLTNSPCLGKVKSQTPKVREPDATAPPTQGTAD